MFITTVELEEGNPQEPPMPNLELIVADYRGKELDLVLEQTNHEFLSDDNFVKSRAFYQFSWRNNIEKFEEICNKRKAKHPKKEDAVIHDEIKDEMMQEFIILTHEEGRRMIKSSGVLLFPNWNITDAMNFNTVTKKLHAVEKVQKGLRGDNFSEDHATLVILSLRRGSRASFSQSDDTRLVGNLIVKRVEDTPNDEAA